MHFIDPFIYTRSVVCCDGSSSTVFILLLTESYHSFKYTWSFSLSINVYPQNISRKLFSYEILVNF